MAESCPPVSSGWKQTRASGLVEGASQLAGSKRGSWFQALRVYCTKTGESLREFPLLAKVQHHHLHFHNLVLADLILGTLSAISFKHTNTIYLQNK